MNLKRQAWWNVAASSLCRLGRAFGAVVWSELGVTSIEYALLASLIAVAALASISLLGGGVEGMWGDVAGAVAGAM